MQFHGRFVGRSKVRVGRLGFGGSSLANLYRELSEADVAETVATALAAGIRYFDTAPLYGFGLSERRLGIHLRSTPRTDLVLSTKIGRTLYPGMRDDDDGAFHSPPPFAHRFDFTYDGVMRQVEDSLQRLGTDRLDLVVVHDIGLWHMREPSVVDRHFSDLARGGLRAVAELRRDGRIGGIGAGLNELTVGDRFLELGGFDFFLVALRYTLLDQSAAGFMAKAAKAGAGIVIGAPFQSGILATGVTRNAHYNYGKVAPEVADRVLRLEAICAAHAVPLRAAALQFPLQHEAVVSVLAGMASAQEVRENVEAATRPIPPGLWSDIANALPAASG